MHRSGPGLISIPLLAVLLAMGASPSGSASTTGAAPGFELAPVDKGVEPCSDFYQYACGPWMKANPIPPDRGIWGSSAELQDRNLAVLRGILEKAAAPGAARDAIDQKIGDYYASCMDEKGIESRGAAPLKADLDRVAALESKAGLAPLLARLHLTQAIASTPPAGTGPLFDFGSEQDFKDATSVIAGMDQGGLGLPERDYYLKEDAKSAETRAKYVEHVGRTFELLGDVPEKAAAEARGVMELETALAKGSLDLVKRRDPANVYHRMSFKEFQALAPSFDWPAYFEGIGVHRPDSLNVRVPEFFQAVESLLQSTALQGWKDYLRWQVARSWSPFLSAAFVNEDFEFYGKTLGGAKELRPRWKRCVDFTDANLGEALGRRYVEAAFGAAGKERTLKMLQAIEKSLGDDIRGLTWMGETTKKRALEKLRAITNKIGYPDRWRDYGPASIAPGELLPDTLRCREFDARRQLAKIGKPVDRGEWLMSPPTVNAYYRAQMNDITFPAGILQPPYYGVGADDAVNFGGIGMVIGHELTHGFDDRGRKFDPDGNLRDWWTPEDASEFEKRATCLADEYSGFVAVDDVKLNGRQTLGENTADNGGLRVAYMALHDTLAGKESKSIDGFTPEQRFFLAYGQAWCANVSDEAARLRAQTDTHSLSRFRVNGVVSNMPEFHQAFGCKSEAPMVRENLCRVW